MTVAAASPGLSFPTPSSPRHPLDSRPDVLNRRQLQENAQPWVCPRRGRREKLADNLGIQSDLVTGAAGLRHPASLILDSRAGKCVCYTHIFSPKGKESK